MLLRGLLFALLSLLGGAAAARAQGAPLDVADPTPRAVRVAFEDSADLSAVGQSFGPVWPATWSVTGNVGRVEIDVTTHAVIAALLALAGWLALGPGRSARLGERMVPVAAARRGRSHGGSVPGHPH